MKRQKNNKIQRRKRNPPPLYFNELKELIGKKVTVQFGSELGIFLVEGILQQLKSVYTIETVITDFITGASITFDRNQIEKIIKNTIILNIPSDQKWPVQLTTDVNVLVNKRTRIWVNAPYWESKGLKWPKVFGILRYNKKKQIFYISKLNSLYLTFKKEAIVSVIHPSPNAAIYTVFVEF